MEYAAGGDLSDAVQRCKLPGVRIKLGSRMTPPPPSQYSLTLSPSLRAVLFLPTHIKALQLDTVSPQLTADCRCLQRGISEPDSRWLFQQLTIAVDYCHRLGIANRDIKVCAHSVGPGSQGSYWSTMSSSLQQRLQGLCPCYSSKP